MANNQGNPGNSSQQSSYMNNQMLDAQLSTIEAINRLAQQRVVFEGQVSDEIAAENDLLRQSLVVRNNLNQEGTKQVTTQQEINKATRENLGIARSIQSVTASELGSKKLIEKIDKDKSKVQGNINFLKKQALEIEKEQINLNRRFQQATDDLEKKALQARIENNNTIVDSLNRQVHLSKDLIKELQQVKTISEAIANDGFLKIFNSLKDIVNLIPGLRELLPGFNQAAESYREALVLQKYMGLTKKQQSLLDKNLEAFKKGKKQPGGLNKEFMKDLPKDLQDQLKDKDGELLTGTAALARMKALGLTFTTPIRAAITALGKFLKKFLLLQFVNAILKADKVAGDLAKSMNVSYTEAALMGNEFNSIANTSNSIFVTTKGLQETQMAINKELGTAAMLTDEQLTTMTKLREAAGFTNEELMGAFKLSATTGKEMETITGEVLAQAKITSLKNGVVLNEREILKEISKVSAATTLSLGKSGEAIAEAVTTAKALGMELSKVEAIAGSILQFESSIEDELSAELLIGKELNLERARFAALNNDVATLSEEIAANFGTAAEFGELSRIQQDALAKAVGMNREELAQTLYVQEQLAGISGKEAEKRKRILNARIAEVGLTQAQQEIAEEGFETLENQASVQDQLIALTEKLNEVFASLAPIILPILNTALAILKPISTLVGYILEGFKAMAPVLIPVLAIMNALWLKSKAIAIMNVIKGSWTALGGTPIVGPILAAAAIAAGIGYIKSQKADDLMSSPTGATGYGDRILIGKEGAYAFNNRDTIQASTQTSSGPSKTEMLLEKILAKNSDVYMDTSKVGYAESLSFSKL